MVLEDSRLSRHGSTLSGRLRCCWPTTGIGKRAAELYALTERVWAPRDDAWSVAVARGELAGIAAALPVDVAAAAQTRGQARDLWATARELLAELESAGWGTGVTET